MNNFHGPGPAIKKKKIHVIKSQNYEKTLSEIQKLSYQEDYFNFLQNLSTITSEEDLINALTPLTGKRMAQTLGKQLYHEGKDKDLFGKKEESDSALDDIEKELDDQKYFLQFKGKLKAIQSQQEYISTLTQFIGKKKAQPLAKKLYQEISLKLSRVSIQDLSISMRKSKDSIYIQNEIDDQTNPLQQIEDILGNNFSYFIKMAQNSNSPDSVSGLLSKFMRRERATILGQKYFKHRLTQKKSCQKFKLLPLKPLNPEKKMYKQEQKGVLFEIQKRINDFREFENFKRKMNSFFMLEELTAELSKYCGSLQAEKLAHRLFRQLGKNIIVDPISILFQDLKTKNCDHAIITKIRHLIDYGKKAAVERLLVQSLGTIGGPQMFNKYKEHIMERPSFPRTDSIQINKKNGLQIYEYKETLSQAQKLTAKTIIVFGQTGCGKSTFLNAIVNYLSQLEMEDSFRYKIIIENEDNQKASLTNKITSYYIKNHRTHLVYRLIDTPGFGDTTGIQKDTQIVRMVRNTFQKEIDCIHNILFVMKASTTRVTPYQSYVFQNIMDLFSKDIAPNFVFIFTFSDSGKPQVLQAVQDEISGFGRYWGQISQPKYLEVNSCGIFERIDITDKIKMGYWEIGMLCMDKLFEKVNKIQSKSLKLSRDLLNKKQSLANQMRVNQQTMRNAITTRQNLFKQIERVLLYQEDIDSNKDFTYLVDSIQWYQQSTDYNVTRCLNCLDCNCHQNCRYGNDEDKKNCVAMENQHCKICENKCHFTLHKNDHYVKKMKTVQVKRENAVNKQKYLNSSKGKTISQTIVIDLINKIETEVKNVIQATNLMVKIQQDLIANQMSTNKPQTTIQYMEYLIANQQKTHTPGYQGRIKNMGEIIHEMKFYKTLTHKGSEQVSKLIKGHQLKQLQATISKASPGLFDKFKRFFS